MKYIYIFLFLMSQTKWFSKLAIFIYKRTLVKSFIASGLRNKKVKIVELKDGRTNETLLVLMLFSYYEYKECLGSQAYKIAAVVYQSPKIRHTYFVGATYINN